MPRRIVVFVALAVASAAVFVRLGFWQLDRLTQRRALNAAATAQMANAEVPFGQLTRANVALRRVVLEGVPDTANEFVVTGRSRNGSPGVHIITPYKLRGDTMVLVNRGWVYAPDAATADLARWRERRTVVHGYTQLLQATRLSGGGPDGADAAPCRSRIRYRARDRAAAVQLRPALRHRTGLGSHRLHSGAPATARAR